jgi:hypothetical protein
MIANEIVHVVAMGNTLMRTVETMGMNLVMTSAQVIGRASVRIGRANFEHVFIHVIGMRMMQMAIVQIVGMASVDDGHVTARRTMSVSVILMVRTGVHCDLLVHSNTGRRLRRR